MVENNTPRTSVPKRVRYEVLRRDNHTCRYCGASAPDVKLTVDHVTPVVLGGTHEPNNLVAACQDCNAGKSSTSPGDKLVDDVKQDALRWSKAFDAILAERFAAIRDESVQVKALEKAFRAHWDDWTIGGKPVPLPSNYGQSLLQILKAGITQDIFEHFIDVAMNAKGVKVDDVFRYFCGCCYRLLKDAADATVGQEQPVKQERKYNCEICQDGDPHDLHGCYGKEASLDHALRVLFDLALDATDKSEEWPKEDRDEAAYHLGSAVIGDDGTVHGFACFSPGVEEKMRKVDEACRLLFTKAGPTYSEFMALVCEEWGTVNG
jgi:hypothetical protein